MLKRYYSVHDNVADLFGLPWTSHSDNTAVRDFSTAAQSPETTISKNPSHFTLYYIGDFNEETGFFNAAEKLTNLGTASGALHASQ